MNGSSEIKIGKVTAGVIIIGNEVLSGRTQDTNLAYMGKQLDALGIRIMESRVIPDIEQTIIEMTSLPQPSPKHLKLIWKRTRKQSGYLKVIVSQVASMKHG